MTLDELVDIYERRATRPYGLEGVSQLEHALQTATIAQDAGQPDTLVAAALLHDVGHMVHGLGENPADGGVDDRHEALGAAALVGLFPDSVCEPIRLHVAAKRYLVAADPLYRARLSTDSILSLALQGGPMSNVDMNEFHAGTWFQHALSLRKFDEEAKIPNALTPSFRDFLPLLEACRISR